jgi:hypothetical protein
MMMMSAMVVDEKLPGQFASKRFISILPQSAGFLVLGYPPAVGRGRQYNVSLDSISTSFLHQFHYLRRCIRYKLTGKTETATIQL